MNITCLRLLLGIITMTYYLGARCQEELLIGCTTDLSGTMSSFSLDILSGINAIFENFNAQGGVQGKKLKLVTLDDQYNGQKARANIEHFLKEKLDIILSPFGTPTLTAYLDIIKSSKILVLFPITSGTTFQKSDYKNLIKFRESSGSEGYGLAKYAYEELEAKKIVLLYQTGLKSTLGAEGYFAKKGFKDFILVECDARGSNVKSIIPEIKKFNPDAFLFFSMPAATVKFLDAMGVSYFEDKKCLALSGLSQESFKKYLKEKQMKFVFSSILPNPATSTLPIAVDFMSDCSKKGLSPDVFSFEGYVNASVFVEILKKVQGPVTHEKILSIIERMKNFDVGGLKLTFNPDFRSLSSSVWLDTGSPSWKKISVEELFQVQQEKKVSINNQKALSVPSKQVEQLSLVGIEHEEKIKSSYKRQNVSNNLVFGCPADLSRNISMLARPIITGIELVFTAVNANGGIQGKKLVLETVDDQYMPELTRGKVDELLHDKIDTFLSPFGTPTMLTYLDLIKEGKILVLFPYSASSDLRRSDLRYMIHLRQSLAEEGSALARYALETLHARKIVVLCQSGVPSNDGILTFFNKKGFKDFKEVSYERKTTNFESQIKEFNAFQPDCIIAMAIPQALLEFIRQYHVENLAGKHLLAWSALYTEQFKKAMQERGLKVVFTSPLPDPATSMLPIVVEFRQECEKSELRPELFTFEGYLNARTLVEILKKIEGPITKEKIIQTAESFQNFDLGGISLTFNPQTRTLLSTMWLVTGDEDWKMVPIEVPAPLQPESKKPIKDQKVSSIKNNQAEPIAKVGVVEQEKMNQFSDQKSVSDRLVFGCPTDLSRNISMLSLPLIAGIELVFNAVNGNGGIYGKKLVLQAVDDQYTPELTRVRVQELINDKVDIFLTPVGDPTIASYLNLIKEGKVLVLFPYAASLALRKPDLKYLIHFRSSLTEEGYALAKYALETLHVRKIVILYQADIPSIDGILTYFSKKGFKEFKEISYERKTTNFDLQVKKVNAFQPDCIIDFAIPQASLEFIRQYHVENLAGKQLLAWSVLYTEQFKKSMRDRGLKVVFATPFPNPMISTLPIAAEFRQDCAKSGLKPELFAFEGYLNARLLVEILKKIKGPVTKEKIIQTVESLKDFDLGGFSLTFNAQTRSLFSPIWLTIDDEDWKMVAGD